MQADGPLSVQGAHGSALASLAGDPARPPRRTASSVLPPYRTAAVVLQVVPFLYGSKPALLQLGSGLPYSQIMMAVKRDAAGALVVFVAAVAFAVAKALHLL